MVDRLTDTRSRTGGDGPPATAVRSEVTSPSAYSNPDPGSAVKGVDDLEDFYARVTEVQNGIKEVKNLTQKVNHLYANYLQNADKEETKKMSDELEAQTEQVHAVSQKVKDILKKITEEIEKKKAENDKSKVADLRIMENQHSYLLKQFIETMKIYHSVQSENEKKYKEQVVRRLKTKFTNDDGSTISEAKAQQMADELLVNGATDQIFQQSKHKLEQIIETRNEVVKIEKAIRELHQLFVDLASLVHEQGELLDDIAHNMQTTNNYMAKGIQELKKAKTYTKKSRRKLMYVICCILVIIVAITVPVFGMKLVK